MSVTKVLENRDLSIFILRVAVGGLMLFHGNAKMIYGHVAILDILAGKGLPSFLWVLVPLTEILAPLFLILGLLTRISSLGIALIMICAIFLALGWRAFAIGEYGGLVAELNLLFFASALALLFTGGVKYNVSHGGNTLLG